MKDVLKIRVTVSEDLADILTIEEKAFNSSEEAELVRQLLEDPTAEPIFSLLAFIEDKPVGHIMFSKVIFYPAIDVGGSILGPLAVIPEYQKRGVGGQLIGRGLEMLRANGVDWVFVLGHESYYPRFGFKPAINQGFEPPYPIQEEFSNAWMAQALTPTCIATYQGKIIPAKTFNDPKYWSD